MHKAIGSQILSCLLIWIFFREDIYRFPWFYLYPKIAEIRHGQIRLTPEFKKEIEKGKWVMGGCLSHPALPKWLC